MVNDESQNLGNPPPYTGKRTSFKEMSNEYAFDLISCLICVKQAGIQSIMTVIVLTENGVTGSDIYMGKGHK